MNATSTTTAQATSTNVSNNSSKAIITINVVESLVQVSWTSAPTPDELAASADYLVAIIKQHGITQLLHDVRMVDYVNIDLQRCLTHVFSPQIVAAGVTKIVHLANYVLPDLFVIDQITDCLKRRYVTDRNTKFEICTTPEGAADWFKYNSFTNPVVAQKQEGVKIESSKITASNEVSPVITLLRTYKEKVSLLGKILFRPKAIYSDL